MSFDLPNPRTPKEYFMAIAAGGVPGEDFPARYEVAPTVEHKDDTFAVTLVATTAATGYRYEKAISLRHVQSGPGLTIKINGKSTTMSGNKYVNEDGYTVDPGIFIIPNWTVYIESETELSGSALNVTVEAIYDVIVPGIPLQPRTMEEAYWAYIAEQDVTKTFTPKTRSQKYMGVILQINDGNNDDDGGK